MVTMTALNPSFVLVPLAASALLSFSVLLWQWFRATRDWTILVPTLCFIFSLLSLAGVVRDVFTATGQPYVRLADIARFQENSIVGRGEQRAMLFSLIGNSQLYAQSTHPPPNFVPNPRLSSSVASPPNIPTTIVRDADDQNLLTRASLALVAVFVVGTVGTTWLHLAPGPFYGRVRRRLPTKQALAPTGTVRRGSDMSEPRAVPSHIEEENTVCRSTSSEQQKLQSRSLPPLKELEIEAHVRDVYRRALTDQEIADMKRPLYDLFDAEERK